MLTVAAVFFIASQRKPTPVIALETKVSEAAEVTVAVTPIMLKRGLPASFDVAFETHSVDLAFDVEKIAVLTDGSGSVYTPFWDGTPAGGHHRRGTLRFTPDFIRTDTLTLTFNDIAGIPVRTFTWDLNP